jgi:hypothetical protein
MVPVRRKQPADTAFTLRCRCADASVREGMRTDRMDWLRAMSRKRIDRGGGRRRALAAVHRGRRRRRQEIWEESPDGYPQTAPYEWWNWHDEYGDTRTSDEDWVRRVADSAQSRHHSAGGGERP